MSSSAEKTVKPANVARQTATQETFFRKADEQSSFFGGKEESSFFGGNEQSFFAPAAVQPKLSISTPDDPYEKEADSVAEQVMRMPEPVVASPVAHKEEEKLARKEDEGTAAAVVQEAPSITSLQRKTIEDESSVPGENVFSSADGNYTQGIADSTSVIQTRSLRDCHTIQRSGRDPPAATHTGFESSLSSSKGGGSALPDTTRQFMEQRFQADFSGVRIHTGTQAEQMSSSIHAQAFAHGSDIYFNSGKFAPGTAEGSHLLAHELTHTIQQGASRATVSRKPSGAKDRPVPSQLNNAVAHAKGEEGKVNANKPGADGYRTGWERLVDYFKTTLGADKVIGNGQAYKAGAVSENDIKKQRKIDALPPAVPKPNPKLPYKHDAMPSWCGIFAFWALHKGGVPMRPWMLGGPNVKPEAAYPKGYIPKAGDIAYRNEFSHYAIVEKATGSTVTTVNGNTAGEDNLGGQVQTRDHPMSGWTAFFDPLILKDGELTSGDAALSAKPRTLKEMRQALFHINRKAEPGAAHDAPENDLEENHVQCEAEQGSLHVNSDGNLCHVARMAQSAEQVPELQAKEEPHKEEEGHALTFDHGVQKKAAGGPGTAYDTDEKAQDDAAPVEHEHHTITDSSVHAGYDPIQRQESMSPSSGRGPPSVQLKVNVAGGGMIQCSWLGDAWDAVSGFASEAAQWVEEGLDKAKEWILNKIRDFVKNIPGYSMLSVIMGEDPITSAPVARTGRNILLAGLDLLPAGGLFRSVMERIGAMDKAAAWIDGRMEGLLSMVSSIGSRFTHFYESLSLDDIGNPEGVLNRVAELFRGVFSDITNFITNAAGDFLEMIKRIVIKLVVDFVRSKIPSLYPLLTVAFGYDPITGVEVVRNGTNILNALLEVSEEGREQRKQMQETGTFQKIAAWIDRGIHVFSTAYHQLKDGIANIWDFITIESLVHPIETYDRLYNQFAAPVKLVWDYIKDTAIEILRVIKEVLLSRLSTWAKGTRGYPLLCVIIGKDPFTGVAVPRNVENVIRGFMSLMEGGEEQFNQLKESGAIDRATQKVHAAVAKLNMTPAAIIQLFTDLWNTMSLQDLVHPIEAFKRIVATFGRPIARLIAFIIEIIKIVIVVILEVMNFPFALINNIIAKAMLAFELIKRDPVGFLKNLLRAIKQGFMQFFGNILTHLWNGLKVWFLGEVKAAGIPIPTDFTVMGIIKWLLAVLDITMEKIWKKLEERIGKEKVAKIRSLIDKAERIAGMAVEAYQFMKDVQERGFMAVIVDKIKEKLNNAWDMVLGAVQSFVMDQIVNKITQKLLMMLDPTGIMAVINSAIALYKAIQSFIKYLRQMLEIVNSFVEGTVEIAQGATQKAADFLEGSLAKGVPIVIGFLANQVGLNLSERLKDALELVREKVDIGLTWVIDKLVTVVEKLVQMGRDAVGAIKNWWQARKEFTADGESHSLYIEKQGGSYTLMVASNPTQFKTYITKKETEFKSLPKTDPKIKAIADARIVTGRLETELAKLEAADNVSQAQRQALPTNQNQAGYDKVNQELDLLMPLMTQLMSRGTDFPPIRMPIFVNNVVAGNFRAEYIKTGRFNRFSASNSGSHRGNLEGWKEVQTAGLTANGDWLKMHMYTHRLGGLATDSNLTPGSRMLNDSMEQFEDTADQAVIAGETIWYEVSNVSYQKVSTPAGDRQYLSSISANWGKYDTTPDGQAKPVADPRNNKPVSESGIAAPNFSGTLIYNMNDIGEDRLQGIVGLTEWTARKVAAGLRLGKVKSLTALEGKLNKLAPPYVLPPAERLKLVDAETNKKIEYK